MGGQMGPLAKIQQRRRESAAARPPRHGVVGLCSTAPGSGKSTLAGLMSNHCENVTVRSFADPLRSMTTTFLMECGYTPDDIKKFLTDRLLKEAGLDLPGAPSPRWIQRSLGTEWGRKMINPEIWLFIMKQKIKVIHEMDPTAIVVIDDVRFPNEYDLVHDLGGIIAMITRPEAEAALHEEQQKFGVHASDQPPDRSKVDHLILNNMDLSHLNQCALQLYEIARYS